MNIPKKEIYMKQTVINYEIGSSISRRLQVNVHLYKFRYLYNKELCEQQKDNGWKNALYKNKWLNLGHANILYSRESILLSVKQNNINITHRTGHNKNLDIIHCIIITIQNV